MLMSITLLFLWACCTHVNSASYPKWPNNFRWATSGDHILFKRHKYKCTQFKEPNDLKWTSNKYLCWKGQTTADLQFSNSGSKTNKRCVLLDEPSEPSNTGWENNHLCVPQDSPYHFTWSHQGRIEGLDCLKLKVDTDPHSWNDNFLCGWQSSDNMIAMKKSLASLNEDGQEDLTSNWDGAEVECLKSGDCTSQLNTLQKDLGKVAAGFTAGKAITDAIVGVMQSGQFAELAGHLGKFAPFLGAFGSIVGIAGMFAPSAQGQQIQEIMKILNEGFNRMEHRFDRIEERLDDLERTIKEEHFWTRLVSRLEDLSNVRSRVTGYLSVSDPAVKASRKADLDMSQYNSIYDAIIAIIDTFDGTNQPLDLCETVKEYSNIDRKVVLGVSIDLYNRMIRGVMDLVLIAKVLDRADVSKTQEEFAVKLERIGKAIGECDNKIESEAWLGTWQSDAMSVLGNTGKGKEDELADGFYDSLRTKYYWRDWLVVVYHDMYGSVNHWRRYCNNGVTTLVLTHWKNRYNIIISSVPSDKKSQPFTVDSKIITWECEKYADKWHVINGGGYWKKRPKEYDAKKIYDSFPADAKKCKYPIAGVVYARKKEDGERKGSRNGFALRAPENRKYYQIDAKPIKDESGCSLKRDQPWVNVFVLG